MEKKETTPAEKTTFSSETCWIFFFLLVILSPWCAYTYIYIIYIFSLLLSALLKAAFIFYNSTPAGRRTGRPAKPAPREEVMVVREHDQKAMSYLNSPTHISVCWRRCCRFDRLTHQNISPARIHKRETAQ